MTGQAQRTMPTTLFSIPFHSAMSDADAARLRSLLDITLYLKPKPGVRAASLGVVSLDRWSELVLARGEQEGEWILEGRTWGRPSDAQIHEWHLLAASAARQLDPAVALPPRQALASSAADQAPSPSAQGSGRAFWGRRRARRERRY